MYKSVLLLASACLGERFAKPPHPHKCETNKGDIAFGLRKNYEAGGCQCADDSAKWSGGPGIDAQWACHCQGIDTYASYPYVELDGAGKIDDRNRKECGIIVECQTVAIL